MSLPFRDLYEDLQLSPNASQETIERVYRLLAKRYHPDNLDTGDAQKFSEVHTAYEWLTDPARRAAYDVTYEQVRASTWRIFDQQSAGDDREHDRRIFQGILWYLKARGWIEKLDSGHYAITVEGIDKVTTRDFEPSIDRMLPPSTVAS